jgi:glycosyltransferase involved in cell wall biosynthesis
MVQNKIKVIVPFHNPGKNLERCINSLLLQDYDNYEILFIDDASTDNSFSKIPAVKYKGDKDGNLLMEDGEPVIESKHHLLDKTNCKKIEVWRSNERMANLFNIHNAVMKYATDPNDIVVIVEGVDFLFKKHVLSKINELYNNENQP